MDIEASAPPVTPERSSTPKSLNPFLNMEETIEEGGNESADPVLIDDSTPPQETNPFRRSSLEREGTGRNVLQNGETKL